MPCFYFEIFIERIPSISQWKPFVQYVCEKRVWLLKHYSYRETDFVHVAFKPYTLWFQWRWCVLLSWARRLSIMSITPFVLWSCSCWLHLLMPSFKDSKNAGLKALNVRGSDFIQPTRPENNHITNNSVLVTLENLIWS